MTGLLTITTWLSLSHRERERESAGVNSYSVKGVNSGLFNRRGVKLAYARFPPEPLKHSYADSIPQFISEGSKFRVSYAAWTALSYTHQASLSGTFLQDGRMS